jgi:UDP-N-acetylglucosamine 2-epimerase (non-hydrolysing)
MKNKKKKIFSIFGTRPEAIKMAPVVKKLDGNRNFISKTIVTGQHRKMLDQVLDFFKIKPAYDLNIMIYSQPLHTVAAKCMHGLRRIYENEKPDLVLIHGDTATALASALAAYYSGIEVAHVEAGLRSYDNFNPFPEEQNRKLADVLSTYHFAPTSGNRANLIKENISSRKIMVTGNTVIDALLETSKKIRRPSDRMLQKLEDNRRVVLVTAHRRENIGKPLERICRGLLKLSRKFRDVDFVYPVHLNPDVRKAAEKYLSCQDNFHLIPPVAYSDMVWIMNICSFCFTDSGGLQEEVPALGKPVLVLRKVTERPEAVKAGTVKVIGTGEREVFLWGMKLLTDLSLYNKFAKAVNPYGDGKASLRIINYLEYIFGIRKEKPLRWKM